MTVSRIKSAAIDAACTADIIARHLLVAGTKDATPEVIREHLIKVYSVWPTMCRAMADLERLAPKSAALGQDANEDLMASIAIRKASVERGETLCA